MPGSLRLLAVAALIGVAAVGGGCSEDEGASGEPLAAPPAAEASAQAAGAAASSGITATGTGSVSVVPDRLDASFGVETQAATADEALSANAEAMQEVIDAIKAAGVADEDVQTHQVSVYPRYSSDGSVIVGFSATNTVTAKIRELERAGAVIDAAVVAGANQVSSLALTVSDQTGPYRQALGKALEDARAKAETIAEAAGLELGELTSVVEGSTGVSPPAAEAAATTPIEPGVQEIQATVTVTYAVS
jgi:hypothetical protein